MKLSNISLFHRTFYWAFQKTQRLFFKVTINGLNCWMINCICCINHNRDKDGKSSMVFFIRRPTSIVFYISYIFYCLSIRVQTQTATKTKNKYNLYKTENDVTVKFSKKNQNQKTIVTIFNSNNLTHGSFKTESRSEWHLGHFVPFCGRPPL